MINNTYNNIIIHEECTVVSITPDDHTHTQTDTLESFCSLASMNGTSSHRLPLFFYLHRSHLVRMVCGRALAIVRTASCR